MIKYSLYLYPGGNRYRPGNGEPTGPSVGQASLGGTADPFTGEIPQLHRTSF